jgi:hypothetical protein
MGGFGILPGLSLLQPALMLAMGASAGDSAMQWVRVIVVLTIMLGCARPGRTEWVIHSSVDRMTEKTVRHAALAAKAEDQGVSAALEMSCHERRRWFHIRLSRPMTRGELGASLRIDEGKVEPRFLHVFSDPYRIPLIQAPPFDLVGKKRFRVQLFVRRGSPLFFDFDLSGIAAAAKSITC